MSFKFFSNPSLTLPAIGANFAASGPYSGYVLLGTVPADGVRQEVSAANLSTSVAVLVLDSGSTPVGSVPAAGAATTVALSAASTAGGPGGVYQDKFQGRMQIYGATASAQIAVCAR
jgi:hypothetical protein